MEFSSPTSPSAGGPQSVDPQSVDPDEARRLETLQRYDLPESPPAEAIDRITRTATRLFDVPAAMVNFIDRNDQRCISARGIGARRLSRELSFCTHTITKDEVMVVEDATDDPRFAGNPVVTGDPHIRFYAGAPLTAPNGHRLGTLCLIDDEPRDGFSDEDRAALQDLADLVMDELVLRRYADSLGNTLESHRAANIETTQILESITDAFFALDGDWNFTYVNAQAEELLERSREELIGENVWNEFEPAVGSTFYEAYHRAVDEGETVEFIEHYPPLDRWFEETAFPFESGLSVYFDDGTERIQAQRDLRREQDLTEAIIDTSIAAVVTVDTDGTITFANDRASEILGAPVDEMKGRHHLEAGPIYTLDGTEIEPPDWPFRRILAAKETVTNRRFVIRGSEGQNRVITVNGAPLLDEDGDIRQVVFSIVDVTDQVERQRELEEAKEKAERASRLKSSFLANLSHDVRTPLSSIMSLTELLARQVPEDCRDRVHLIERSSQRLLDMLDSVLDLSKIESGSVDIAARPVDVAKKMRKSAELFHPQAEESDIDLQAEIPETEISAELDPALLNRIVDNLVSNALKFTDPGGTVTLRMREDDGRDRPICIEVEDTGVGIEKDFLPDLFEAFARGPDRETDSGTGLGLAITKRLTDVMNGTIDVESERGVGTRFTLRLPRTVLVNRKS